MNLKNSKNRAGFTLIELIVVIAIMAILAGVAVPVYSGYIEKAEKAADLQLLGAVNSAFGAACIENDTDVHSVEADFRTPSISSGFRENENIAVDLFNDEFQKYFAGNAGGFKVIKQLLFVNGAFVDPTSGAVEGVVPVTYAGQTLYVTQAQVDDLVNSTYGEVIGTQALMGKVDYVTQLAAELMSGELSNSTFAQLIAGPEYGALLAENLGIDLGAENGTTDFLTAVGGMVNDKMDMLIASGAYPADADKSEGSDLYNAAYNQIVANNAVLNAAKNSNTAANNILSVLGGDDAQGSILQTINKNSGEGLSQAAMAYGLYTAYAAQNNITVSDDPGDVLAALDSDQGFKNYINNVDGSGQAQKDLDGYLAAMNMVNSNISSNPDAVSDILVNGFANDELVNMMEQLTGK